jgi:hypothetical protein
MQLASAGGVPPPAMLRSNHHSAAITTLDRRACAALALRVVGLELVGHGLDVLGEDAAAPAEDLGPMLAHPLRRVVGVHLGRQLLIVFAQPAARVIVAAAGSCSSGGTTTAQSVHQQHSSVSA